MNGVGRSMGDQWAWRVEQGPLEGPDLVLLLVLQVGHHLPPKSLRVILNGVGWGGGVGG